MLPESERGVDKTRPYRLSLLGRTSVNLLIEIGVENASSQTQFANIAELMNSSFRAFLQE